MNAAEYKHIVLGLIFLKYISDAFEELHSTLLSQVAEGADPEDKNEYTAEKVFYVPPSSRWTWLQGRAKLPTIGKDIDDAMDAIEKDNPSLRGVLPKVFAHEKHDKASLGGLIDMFATATLGTKEARSKDILGKVYEYFLEQFALAEGKKGGQFYTPTSVVKLLVEMLEPYEGRVFDPCCGSGGMFVQSEKFVEAHRDYYKQHPANGGTKKLFVDSKDRIADGATVRIYYESRLAKVNLDEEGKRLIEEFDKELEEDEEITQKQRAKAKWTKLEAIVGNSERVKNLATRYCHALRATSTGIRRKSNDRCDESPHCC